MTIKVNLCAGLAVDMRAHIHTYIPTCLQQCAGVTDISKNKSIKPVQPTIRHFGFE